jgi:peptide/nickel transport system substrate-binding protein
MGQSLAARAARILAAAGLASALLAPGAVPVAAADPKILQVGTLQDLDSTNPYGTILGVGYEAYSLTYDQLVGFGPNVDPVPGFASSWKRADDGKSWIFKFRPDLKWSDGQPATSADACFSWKLNVDAQAADDYIGAGYIDYELGKDGARVSKVECPDPETMIVYTDDASDRVLQTYIPILPKHIYGKLDYKKIGDEKFEPPADGSGLVGTGPYQLVEWKTGEFVRFKRNPNYWGTQGAADEIVIRFFGTNEVMVQALKAGEIDYAHNVSSEQLDQLKTEPDIKTVNGVANGWTELGFNTYGTGTGKTIKGGGPSTKALLDPKFRDALGYAIDKQELVGSVIGGYGTLGSTQIPPGMPGVPGKAPWHTDPATPRTFDIALANQKLDEAGYKLDPAGARLDKEGKAISLSLVMPDSDPAYAKSGQFIKDWFAKLGIKVSPTVYDSDTLGDKMLPPEAGEGKTADYDLFIWDWAWGPDPNDALGVFRCDQIGISSDSLWCDPEYDKLYDKQLTAATPEERKVIVDQMQQMWYDAAPYHVLYYNDSLDAYRTDKFAGWSNTPANGTPMFTYGNRDYPLLVDASTVASPTPEPSSAPAASGSSGSASAAPSNGAGGGSAPASSSLPIVPILVAVVVVAAIAVFLMRRRSSAKTPDEDDE